MLDQINAIKQEGFKPVIFIDNSLAKLEEMIQISRHARKLDIPIYYESSVNELNKIKKLYIFRYGVIPQYTEASIKRKGGKIVSGNLTIN